MLYPMRFNDVYKPYIWGGRTLASLGKRLPDEGIVAESWEISAHPNGSSIIANGSLAGTSLPDAVRACGRSLLGQAVPDSALSRFPLLVKLIDARDRLSVQVHPDDNYARIHEHGENGKNEMWYVVAARPGSSLIAGIRPGVTREQFAASIASGHCLDHLRVIPVRAGDAINIPAGLVHAIGEGLVICEVQQNSDTTYRVYDYDRRDAAGRTRPLHIDKALDVIRFDQPDSSPLIKGLILTSQSLTRRVLVLNRYFLVEEQKIHGHVSLTTDGSRFYTLTILSGRGQLQYFDESGTRLSEDLQAGVSVLIPASLGSYSLNGQMSLISSCPSIFTDDCHWLSNQIALSEDSSTQQSAIQRLAAMAGLGLLGFAPLPGD